jgi:hypothetical protein
MMQGQLVIRDSYVMNKDLILQAFVTCQRMWRDVMTKKRLNILLLIYLAALLLFVLLFFLDIPGTYFLLVALFVFCFICAMVYFIFTIKYMFFNKDDKT